MPRLLLVVLLFVFPVFAANADECANAKSQSSINACARQQYEKSDGALNAMYQRVIKRLTGEDETKKQLVKAQRTWVKFRDAECKFASSGVEGGSAYAMIFLNCANRLTRERIDDFNSYLRCPEGDLSCPVPPG